MVDLRLGANNETSRLGSQRSVVAIKAVVFIALFTFCHGLRERSGKGRFSPLTAFVLKFRMVPTHATYVGIITGLASGVACQFLDSTLSVVVSNAGEFVKLERHRIAGNARFLTVNWAYFCPRSYFEPE